MGVFDINENSDSTTRKMFLDGPVDIQRYDRLKYKKIDQITEKQLGFFWQPNEVDITKDSKDFKNLTEHERHIFESNIQRQILLDSVQGRSPSLTLLPLVSIPELESWLTIWTQNEGLHSRSYTHIIRNIYSAFVRSSVFYSSEHFSQYASRLTFIQTSIITNYSTHIKIK